jgi:UDP-3-O-[3-hydroxymyristoyl] glucosamine N-acyltransferase
MIYLWENDDWKEFERDDTAALDRHGITIGEGVMFGANIKISDGVVIKEFASIEDDVKLGNSEFWNTKNHMLNNRIFIGKGSAICSGAHIGNGVIINKKALVGSNTIIASHTIVGAESRIGDYTTIACHTSIDDYVSIGNDTNICHTTFISNRVSIGNYTYIGSRSFIGHRTAIGNHVNIGNGTFIPDDAKIEDDKTPTCISINGTRYGLAYWGEDRINIGCQSKTIEEWLTDYEEIADEYDFSEKEIAEYMAYVKFIASIHGNNK